MDRKVLTAAVIAAFAILNVVGLFVIANGSIFGSFDNLSSTEPSIHRDGAGQGFSSDGNSTSDVSQGENAVSGTNLPRQQGNSAAGRDAPPGAGPGGAGPKGAREAWDLSRLADSASVGMSAAEEAATGDTPGTIVESKLEEDDDAPYYVVKILGEDENLHEYEIAGSGEITEAEIQASDEAEEARSLLDETSTNREEASSLVTDEFGGEVVENKLTEEEGYIVYEVETLTSDGKLYEAFVDARDAEILSGGMVGDASEHRPGIGPADDD